MPLLHKSAGHERKKAEKTENVEVTKEAEKEAEKEVAPEKEAPKLKLSPIVALAKQAGVSLSGDETIASFLMPESDIPEEVQLRFLDVVETHSGQIRRIVPAWRSVGCFPVCDTSSSPCAARRHTDYRKCRPNSPLPAVHRNKSSYKSALR